MTIETAMTFDELCAQMDIEIVHVHVNIKDRLTSARATLAKIRELHGDDHLVTVLKTIVETERNAGQLRAYNIWAVSDVILDHPSWPETGSRWYDAFDGIDLGDLHGAAKIASVQARRFIKGAIVLKLLPLFDTIKLDKRKGGQPKPADYVPPAPKVYPETDIPGVVMTKSLKDNDINLDILDLDNRPRRLTVAGRQAISQMVDHYGSAIVLLSLRPSPMPKDSPVSSKLASSWGYATSLVPGRPGPHERPSFWAPSRRFPSSTFAARPRRSKHASQRWSSRACSTSIWSRSWAA